MTKQEFWDAVGESLYQCPLDKDSCNKDCNICLQEIYERLERESNDTEFDFKRGYAQSKTDLSLQMIKELDELETPNDYSSDWTNGYNAGVSRMTKIFIKLMKGVKYDGE